MRIIYIFMLLLSIVYAKDGIAAFSSMQANFKQQVQGERGAVPVIYEGIVYAMHNKVKWQYNKPLSKEVYLEGNAAYIYEPQLKQVTIGSLKENVDFIKILRNVKPIKDQKDLYQTTISNVQYILKFKDSKPYSLTYKDELDNNVIIVFSNVVLNAPIDQSVFIFNPPDDVEYIDAN